MNTKTENYRKQLLGAVTQLDDLELTLFRSAAAGMGTECGKDSLSLMDNGEYKDYITGLISGMDGSELMKVKGVMSMFAGIKEG
jgi:hypothetical protein